MDYAASAPAAMQPQAVPQQKKDIPASQLSSANKQPRPDGRQVHSDAVQTEDLFPTKPTQVMSASNPTHH